jgi:hypothetical protein
LRAAASDKVYRLLAHGRWFSPGTPASSTTKTCCHDIAEILLKVALKHQKSIDLTSLMTVPSLLWDMTSLMTVPSLLWDMTSLMTVPSLLWNMTQQTWNSHQ